ncbi:hypothetical protein BGW38_004873, partial [Lunasporangiospora selenospora]
MVRQQPTSSPSRSPASPSTPRTPRLPHQRPATDPTPSDVLSRNLQHLVLRNDDGLSPMPSRKSESRYIPPSVRLSDDAIEQYNLQLPFERLASTTRSGALFIKARPTQPESGRRYPSRAPTLQTMQKRPALDPLSKTSRPAMFAPNPAREPLPAAHHQRLQQFLYSHPQSPNPLREQLEQRLEQNQRPYPPQHTTHDLWMPSRPTVTARRASRVATPPQMEPVQRTRTPTGSPYTLIKQPLIDNSDNNSLTIHSPRTLRTPRRTPTRVPTEANPAPSLTPPRPLQLTPPPSVCPADSQDDPTTFADENISSSSPMPSHSYAPAITPSMEAMEDDLFETESVKSTTESVDTNKENLTPEVPDDLSNPFYSAKRVNMGMRKSNSTPAAASSTSSGTASTTTAMGTTTTALTENCLTPSGPSSTSMILRSKRTALGSISPWRWNNLDDHATLVGQSLHVKGGKGKAPIDNNLGAACKPGQTPISDWTDSYSRLHQGPPNAMDTIAAGPLSAPFPYMGGPSSLGSSAGAGSSSSGVGSSSSASSSSAMASSSSSSASMALGKNPRPQTPIKAADNHANSLAMYE